MLHLLNEEAVVYEEEHLEEKKETTEQVSLITKKFSPKAHRILREKQIHRKRISMLDESQINLFDTEYIFT